MSNKKGCLLLNVVVQDVLNKVGHLPQFFQFSETTEIDNNSIALPDSFHSVEDDTKRDGSQPIQDGVILSYKREDRYFLMMISDAIAGTNGHPIQPPKLELEINLFVYG